MKYVFVNFNYSPGYTPESWFKRTRGYTGVVESLSRNNTVISIKQIDHEGICKHNGVIHHFIALNRDKTLFPTALNRYVKSLKPDVVFVQGLHQPVQLLQLALMLNKKTKIIVQHHAEKPFAGIKKHIQRLAGKYVDAYLFASHDMGMDWVKKGNISAAKKIREVMETSSVFYPVKKETAKLETGISGDPVFLWVGRLNNNKDPMNVIKAFLRFAKEYPRAKLYMIYHTEELLIEINELLSGHPQKEAIILVGKVPHEDLLYWFNSAEFFLAGSHYEGSGTAVCEAMSCGCAPVVTDIPSFRMITDNGRCGFLYQPGDEAGLLSILLQTQQMNMADKRKYCLDYFNSTLSFDAIARRIHDIASSL